MARSQASRKASRKAIATKDCPNQASSASHKTTSDCKSDVATVPKATTTSINDVQSTRKKPVWNRQQVKNSEAYSVAGASLHSSGDGYNQTVDVLTAAGKARDHSGFRAFAFKRLDNFGMNGFVEEVSQRYDREVSQYAQTGDKSLGIWMDTAAMMANLLIDTEIPETSFIRTTIEVDEIRLRQLLIQSMFLNKCIRPIQLFNIEKRWGFDEEAFEALRAFGLPNGFGPSSPAPSLREGLNSPESYAKFITEKRVPVEQILTANCHHDEATIAAKKFMATLKDCINILKQFNASVSIEEPKPPSLPKRIEYGGIAMTSKQKLPKRLRMNLFDLKCIEDCIQQSGPELATLCERAKKVMCYWSKSGKDCYKYASDHIHEMAAMREYEYRRLELAAFYAMANTCQRMPIRWFFKGRDQKRDKKKGLRKDQKKDQSKTPGKAQEKDQEKDKKKKHVLRKEFKVVFRIGERKADQIRADLQVEEEAKRKALSSVAKLMMEAAASELNSKLRNHIRLL